MSFYTSLSGLQASQTEMSSISHNLANVGTNGFKKSRTQFADVIASSVSLSPTLMWLPGSRLRLRRRATVVSNSRAIEDSVSPRLTR